MIYNNSMLGNYIHWERHPNPDAANIARRFLSGERELLNLARARNSAAAALSSFLATAESIAVHRGACGELLVSCMATGEKLLLTGKTADVLRSYLDDEPVSMQDRLDMTQRRRIRT